MIEKTLSEMLKKYINIFINEYQNYLSKEQLETLRNINYQSIIRLDDTDNPFGLVMLGQIHLSNNSNDLISRLRHMENYNSNKYALNNKNISSYLQYMCDNGYSIIEYFGDILMYFVFYLVLKSHSGFNNGLINQEIKYLNIKYSIRSANLFAKEEMLISKICPYIHIENLRKILFMDRASCFKFLNDNLGFRYAKLVDDVTSLIEEKYQAIHKKSYNGVNGLLDYADDYDKISYGDVYNYLLDFEVENKMSSY